MKKLYTFIASLLLAVGIYAEQVTLTLYANDCDSVNTITCPAGQQLRVTAEATLDGSRFERWSDGITTNPRVIVVNGDITLTAIYKSTPTAIGEAESQNSANAKAESQNSADAKVESQKFLRDGVLIIERNGIYYNAQGAVVQ